MSYSREDFEQAVTDRWSNSYSFTRFGDEDYCDEVLEGMWQGWQASRQALEGEAIAHVFPDDIKKLGSSQCKVNAYSVEMGDPDLGITVPLYTHPASADEWIKCSERLPDLGQRVILQSNGVIQNYMPLFDQGDSDFGMGEHFWEFEDVNDIDNPLVNFEEDCWMPLPEPRQQEPGQ